MVIGTCYGKCPCCVLVLLLISFKVLHYCAHFYIHNQHAESSLHGCSRNLNKQTSVPQLQSYFEANFPRGENGMSTHQRIQTWVFRLEKAAMASHVFAAIQHSRVSLCLLLMKHPYFLIHRRTCWRLMVCFSHFIYGIELWTLSRFPPSATSLKLI
jgi:hypothetical protein